jgi:hypothetical protein
MKEDKRKNNDLWNSIQKNKVKETEEQEPHKILGENWGAVYVDYDIIFNVSSNCLISFVIILSNDACAIQ